MVLYTDNTVATPSVKVGEYLYSNLPDLGPVDIVLGVHFNRLPRPCYTYCPRPPTSVLAGCVFTVWNLLLGAILPANAFYINLLKVMIKKIRKEISEKSVLVKSTVYKLFDFLLTTPLYMFFYK